jgi:hypothetical protein
MGYNVTVFRSFPFKVGQKIRIEGTRRAGDWEVAAIGEHKVTLKCPISHKEFTWSKFCYFTEEERDTPWPRED